MTLAVVLSGAAGLIFQVVWLYECGLAFGNSLWSATIVLSSFMCGLAIGNALAVRISRPLVNPLRTYARIELTVGASGLLLTYALPYLAAVVGTLTHAAGSSVAIVNVLRLFVSFVALAVPTTAMGATLPVLVGAFVRAEKPYGHTLGYVYGWNTFGAVLGVVAAELLLVRFIGVKGAAWAAALLNAAAAGIAVRAAASFVPSSVRASAPPHPRPANSAGRSDQAIASRSDWRLLLAAGLSGAILLALEVVWFRFLTMYVLSTTLTVSLMLATVLAAIAAGGIVASAWLKGQRDASAFAAAAALLAGCVTVAAYAAFGVTTSGTQIAEAHRVLWLACALVAPTSFLSGIVFTLLGQAIERGMSGDTALRATAALTLANTIGAAAGAPLATFVLLPALGMEGAIFATALVYLAVAVLAWSGAAGGAGTGRTGRIGRNGWFGPRTLVVGAAALAFAFAIVAFPFGAMRTRYFVRSAQAYADDGSAIVATREGASDTVFLMQQAWLGQPVYDRLVTNGFSMSGTAVPGMRYMRAFAYWPMLLHEGPLKRALVVCYGVGVTAQAVNDITSLESIDVVEISKDVVAMSDIIYEGRNPPLRDPRVRLHIEDGRNYLQASRDRYDLITGEPPPPRTPGTVNIYTREYFQLLYDHLADGGITTYWLPVARPHPGTDVDTIVRAFCDVFTDCSLWNATPFDFMLVGSRAPSGPLSADAFRKPWVTPGLEAKLREVGFEQPEEIGATFLGDADYLRELTKGAPPLVDDFPQRLMPSPSRPSLSDPRYSTDSAVSDFFQRVLDPVRARALFATSPWVGTVWPGALKEASLPAFEYERIINRVLWEGGKPLAQIEDLHFLLTRTPLRTLPLWVLGSDEVKQRIAETSGDASGAVEYARALRAFTGHGYAAAAANLNEAERRGFGGAQVHALRAYALGMAGQLDQARALAESARPSNTDEEHFWQWIRTRIASGAFAS